MQMAFITGRHGEYFWLERADGYLWDILEVCPQIVEGKFVCITASDSGPANISPQEVDQGWQKIGDLVVSSRIIDANQIEIDQFNEYYIYPTATTIKDYEVFVNYGMFLLHQPKQVILHSRFWTQIERFKPESYIAEGDNLVWATNNISLFETAVRALNI